MQTKKQAKGDPDCEAACKEAYRDCVKNCFRVLVDCLATAKNDEEREQCRSRFRSCMQLCKEARDLCVKECG